MLLSISPVPLTHAAWRTPQTADVHLQEAEAAKEWPAWGNRQPRGYVGTGAIATNKKMGSIKGCPPLDRLPHPKHCTRDLLQRLSTCQS